MNYKTCHIQKWIVILSAAWTLHASAENASYTKYGLTFTGPAESIKTLQDAWTAYDDADRVQRQLREQPLPSTPENNEQVKNASIRWYSTRETMYAAALDLKIAPGVLDEASAGRVDAVGTRADIYTLNQFISNYRQAHAESPALYLQWLREMLPAWKDKAGEADILLELGQLSENDPAAAITYYELAAKNDHTIDEYQFRRQQAYQGVARMCEKLGNFKGALEALNKWEIREPCGTGANGSRVRRMFWMWRLRHLNGEDAEVLRSELVHALKTDGWLISTAERDIIAFYGDDKSALNKDIADVILTFENSSDEIKNEHDEDIRVLKAILRLLSDEKRLAAMSDENLIRLLRAPKRLIDEGMPPVPIAPNVLFLEYMEQKKSSLIEIPNATRFWVRAVDEALKRMPKLEPSLKSEWMKHKNHGVALVLALHSLPNEPAYLRVASASDGDLQNMLDDIARHQQSMKAGR